jgi:hypothetical protein
MGMDEQMSEDGAPLDQTSEKGWVRAQGDRRFWIPCPAGFPEGHDRGSWAQMMARAWWEQSGLAYTATAVEQLAAMLRRIHEQGYAKVACHQIWIYLQDPAVPPLPVHIGIWKMQGDRDERLRSLSGADDTASTRPPDVAELATDHLGTGIRAMRYRMRESGALAMVGYAFRREGFETDVQISTATRDLRQLGTVISHIEEFIRGITVQTPGALA